MKRFIFPLFAFLILSFGIKATVCTATTSGDWANASTWSCPGGPSCGDVIIIPVGQTVTVTTQLNYSACSPTPGMSPQVYVYGELQFANGSKLRLPCGSNVYIGSTGSLTPGSGGGSSNYIEICSNTVWKASDGTQGGPSCYPPGCSLSPLPIELIAFTGELEQKVVYLYWKTATETKNDHYDVEKSSNAIDFEIIETVPSKAPNGTSLGVLEYQITDKDLRYPIYYYRLKQVDQNGDFKRTNSISVKIYAAELAIYPNPNNGVFSIDVPIIDIHSELNVSIYNNLGQLVHRSIQYVKNDNITGSRVDISPEKVLSRGVYHTTISFQGEVHVLKLVVQ